MFISPLIVDLSLVDRAVQKTTKITQKISSLHYKKSKLHVSDLKYETSNFIVLCNEYFAMLNS